MERIEVSVFDTKPYDRSYLVQADSSRRIDWKFHEFRLSVETASVANGSRVACVFVNDLVDAHCIQALRQIGIELLALRCAGFNNVDLAMAKSSGLQVTRVPAYSPHAVAEHTIGLLLTLNRRIHRAYNRVRELNFSLSGLEGFDVFGKTVGIVGTGKIGRITAQIFRGFGANVMAFDPFPMAEWAASNGIRYGSWDDVLSQSDILSLHLPLTPETKHLLNDKTLAMTKPGVYILNTSRGKLIDTSALIRSLKSGHIGGVGLDVYEEEEGIFFEDLSGQVLLDDDLSRLLSFPNVLVTSHQAFLTREALTEIARITTQNILALADGQPFLNGTVLT